MPRMAAALALVHMSPAAELIWASPCELLNVFHAEAVGRHRTPRGLVVSIPGRVLTGSSTVRRPIEMRGSWAPRPNRRSSA